MGVMKSFKRDFIITATMLIALGVVFIVFPESSSEIICYILAGLLCLLGVFKIVSYFRSPVSMSNYNLGLSIGLLAVGFGIYLFAKPEILIGVLATAVGVIILINAVINVQNTVDMLRLGVPRWWLMLAVTVITAVLGLIILIKSDVVLQFVGAALIVTGVMDIIDIFVLSKGVTNSDASKKDVLGALKKNMDSDPEID